MQNRVPTYQYPAIQISDPINPRKELLAMPAKNWTLAGRDRGKSEVPPAVGRQWACKKPLNLSMSERLYFEVAGMDAASICMPRAIQLNLYMISKLFYYK